MLPLYTVTYTLTARDQQNLCLEQFKEYISPAIECATHLMGLITAGKKPAIAFYEEPELYAKIIVSVSFGKNKAEHLSPISIALGDLMALELSECEISTKIDQYVLG
jgi:hypothetical protein